MHILGSNKCQNQDFQVIEDGKSIQIYNIQSRRYSLQVSILLKRQMRNSQFSVLTICFMPKYICKATLITISYSCIFY